MLPRTQVAGPSFARTHSNADSAQRSGHRFGREFEKPSRPTVLDDDVQIFYDCKVTIFASDERFEHATLNLGARHWRFDPFPPPIIVPFYRLL